MKKLLFETADIDKTSTFFYQFNELMGFPQWYSSNKDEWIDLISVSSNGNPALARFKSTDPEQFVIEMIDSRGFFQRKPKIFLSMLGSIEKVNKRAVEKIGSPLISVIFL